MNLTVHFDLVELLGYALFTSIAWHLVEAAARYIEDALRSQRRLKHLAIEVALEEQRAKYNKAAREEYSAMLAQHAQAEAARQARIEGLPEVRN